MFRFLLAGLILRLLLAPFLAHPFDMRIFMAVGWAVAHGITPYGQYVLQDIFAEISHPHLYGTFPGIGYPPPWGLICGSMYKISQAFSPNIYVYLMALKVPIIIGDLAAAYLVYWVLRSRLNEKTAFKAFRFYLFCPFLLLVGVVWGMFDVLAFLFSLISAYLLLEKTDLSWFSLGVAVALKPIPVVLVPLYAVFVYKFTDSLKKAARYIWGVAGTAGVLTLLPMALFNWPLSNLYHALVYHVNTFGPGGQYNFGAGTGDGFGSGVTYGCASPFNIVNVVRYFDHSVEVSPILNYLWIAACVAVSLYALNRLREVDLPSVFRWSFLIMLVFFTTRSWVSEQNLLFLLSFFMLTVLLGAGSWKTVHALWIVLFSFVVVHVPLIAFAWMPYPWTLNAASAFCDGPFGWIRWFLACAVTFAWIGICWHYALRRVEWS